ncbi:MAG TPA: ABC transporter substrate-binding protein, partial [Bacilli bacterium]
MRTKQGLNILLIGLLVLALLAAAGCAGKTKEEGSDAPKGNASSPTPQATDANQNELTDVKVVLDWTPNTNHTGLYVAKEKGFFAEHGLNVDIIPPGDAGADAMVAAGQAEFGVSYQESVTQARIQGVPLVSIAAII